jgi:protein arginine kinase
MIWYKDNNEDIVISTRIRLARNIDSVPFPASLKNKEEYAKKIRESLSNSNSTLAGEFEYINLDEMPYGDKLRLAEEHLISPQMLDGEGREVMISKDKTMSVMIMEEDHIRLQIIKSGMALEEAYELADKVDDVMEESITYAFDEEFGYLTACPTNAGTGMRASVMMHLPALTMTNNMNRIISSVNNLGVEVRGLYGEGTKAEGNLYQISNRITMGLSEKEILEKLESVVKQIEEMEKKARTALGEQGSIEDRVYRSLGTLKYARSISSSEAKSLLSDVMLGQNMGILPKVGKMTPTECMVKSAPSFIGSELSPTERDKKRAEMLRENV